MLELSDRIQEQDRTMTDVQVRLTGLRILVVMPTIPLHGMERKTIHVMKGLRERGADVLFITQQTYGQRIQKEVDGIGCRWVPASFDKLLHLPRRPGEALSILRSWVRSASEFNAIRKEYKPTHIHIPNLTFFLYCWPVLLNASETVVFALPNPPDKSFSGLRRHLNNFIWREGVARVCDHIVCNSKFTASELGAAGVEAHKTSIIYNCAPDRPVRSGDAPVVDRSRLNVAFLGRICAEKGVRELVEAALRIASEMENVDFHIAGDYRWQNPFAESLIKEVDSKGLASRVRFIGEVNDVGEFLAQCDLHVCPSVWDEPFGLVVLEAKSQSLPSVIFPSGGLKEVVTHLVDGYVCQEKTSEALYQGLRFFLDRPQLMRQAGQRARRSASSLRESAGNDWASLFSGHTETIRKSSPFLRCDD